MVSVEQKIQELEAAERAADPQGFQTANEKFANALVLGDSIAQGPGEYNVLDQTHVLAERGAGVVNGEGKWRRVRSPCAKSLVPQTLFLAYSMNDMKVTDQESFLAAYRGILEDLKQSLPDTDIYVNCILQRLRQQTAEGRNRRMPIFPSTMKD